MTDNAVVYWLLGHLWLVLLVLFVVFLFVVCWWDGRGRYKAMVREAEKARRE